MIIALVGAFSVIVQLHRLIDLRHWPWHCAGGGPPEPEEHDDVHEQDEDQGQGEAGHEEADVEAVETVVLVVIHTHERSWHSLIYRYLEILLFRIIQSSLTFNMRSYQFMWKHKSKSITMHLFWILKCLLTTKDKVEILIELSFVVD